ncbi:hypothetical protein ES703_109163 [subsurface metagenome]
MEEMQRHIGFLDLLGVRRNLYLGQAEYARRKIEALADIAEMVQSDYPEVKMHGTSAFFLLYGTKPDVGWLTAQAAVRIFGEFYDLNDKEDV